MVLALLTLPVLVLTGLLTTAVPASAHAVLESSSPSQGSQMAAAPPNVALVFSEEVGLATRAVQVVDSRGKRVDDGAPSHPDGNQRSVQVKLQSGLGNGSYTVMWRIVSADGHPASGTFSFGVGVPAGAAPPVIDVDPIVSALRVVVQVSAYAGAALVLGASVFLFVLWPGGQADPRMRRLLVVACAVLGFGAVGTLLVQGPYVSGAGIGGLVDPSLLKETVSSTYGRPLLLRILAAGLSVPVFGIWPKIADDEDSGPGGVAAAGNMLLLAASFALTGHPTEASPKLLAEALDAVHLVSAGAWLGGLVVLFVAFLPATSERTKAEVLPRWSRIAAGCVGALVATGIYQSWREVRAFAAITTTSYGRLLLAKLAVVAVILAVAAVARLRVMRSGPVGSLVRIEALLGLVVLAVTSFLVATPPSRVTFGPPYTAGVTALDVESNPIRLEVAIAPTRTGQQTMNIKALTMEGAPLPFVAASGLVVLEGNKSSVDVMFSPRAPGEGSASVIVPSAGKWTLTVHIVTDSTTDFAGAVTYTVR
jgi:copper transport protein